MPRQSTWSNRIEMVQLGKWKRFIGSRRFSLRPGSQFHTQTDLHCLASIAGDYKTVTRSNTKQSLYKRKGGDTKCNLFSSRLRVHNFLSSSQRDSAAVFPSSCLAMYVPNPLLSPDLNATPVLTFQHSSQPYTARSSCLTG